MLRDKLINYIDWTIDIIINIIKIFMAVSILGFLISIFILAPLATGGIISIALWENINVIFFIGFIAMFLFMPTGPKWKRR